VTRLGFGVVGCGGAAADMTRAIAELEETYVAGVYDRLEPRAAEFAAANGTRAYGSLDELIADPAADVVYVALPHHLLAPTAEAALEAGKHALVEKPLALDVDVVHRLGRLAGERGLLVAPVFELRTSAVAREARRLVSGGAIGDVTAVRIRTVIDKPPAYWHSGPRGLVADGWRSRRAEAGGGVVLMNSIHQLDLVRYVTGLSFVRASAEVATLHADVEIEDSAAAVLRLSNGGIGSLVAAAHSPGASDEEQIEIDGVEGRIDLPDFTSRNAAAARVFLRRPWGGLPAGSREVVEAGTTDTYAELLRAFVGAIEDGTPPAATVEDAASALASVQAIYASASSAAAAEIVAGGESEKR
jgi:predicted dehydrogenase